MPSPLFRSVTSVSSAAEFERPIAGPGSNPSMTVFRRSVGSVKSRILGRPVPNRHPPDSDALRTINGQHSLNSGRRVELGAVEERISHPSIVSGPTVIETLITGTNHKTVSPGRRA